MTTVTGTSRPDPTLTDTISDGTPNLGPVAAYRGAPVITSLGGLPISPDRDELLQRARSLASRLRERQSETAALRELPQASVQEMRTAGMWDLTRPRDHGGYEVDSQTFGHVIAEIARGCGSTAWVAANVNSVSMMVGTLPAQVRDEVFRSGHVGCSVFTCRTGGTARWVEGGYHVEHGQWLFASGQQIAGWVLPRLLLVDDDGTPTGAMLAVVPKDEVTILDEWHTVAMRGSSSNVVQLDDVFIPEHRAHSLLRMLSGAHLPETAANYRQPWLPTTFLGLGWVGVGLATAALELFLERCADKAVAFTTYQDKSEAPRTHIAAGDARARIDAAMLIGNRAAAVADYWAARGEQAPVEVRIEMRADLGSMARLCGEAVTALYDEVGASSIMQSDPLSQIALDMKAVTMHGVVNATTNAELLGRVLCGKEPNVPGFGPVLMT